MQRGSVEQKSGAWYVRFRTTEVDSDGKVQRRLIRKRLAPINDEYRSARDVWPLADIELAKETKGGAPRVLSLFLISSKSFTCRSSKPSGQPQRFVSTGTRLSAT